MALESSSSSTGMSVSSLVMVQGDNEDVRPYTPISLKEDRGYFDLLVKRYPEGAVSSYIHGLTLGQEVYDARWLVAGGWYDFDLLMIDAELCCLLAINSDASVVIVFIANKNATIDVMCRGVLCACVA